MTSTAERMRRHTGPALFSFGFRPFFLFAAVWSALAVPIWVASFTVGDGSVGGLDGRLWHIHEMLFGYVGGIVAGFLLTAVPNWTGRLPVTGAPLAGLFVLWVAGRLMLLAPADFALAAAIVDSAFLAVFAALVWREVLAAGNRRNLPVCLLATLLAAANIAFHLQAVFPVIGDYATRAAVGAISGLIALIGGRVVPSFTRNWTAARGLSPDPVPFNRFDKLVLLVTGLALAAWVLAPENVLTGGALIAAGLMNFARLARWRGWVTGPEPLVWILHLGYVWLPIGLALLGLSKVLPELVPATAGVHALTAGSMGVMTLAMMTRATLGHTGRPRTGERWTTALYVTINLAAILRVTAPFLPDLTVHLLACSAALWALAFALFIYRYGPMLVRRPLA